MFDDGIIVYAYGHDFFLGTLQVREDEKLENLPSLFFSSMHEKLLCNVTGLFARREVMLVVLILLYLPQAET